MLNRRQKLNGLVLTCKGRTGEQKDRTDRNYLQQNTDKEMKNIEGILKEIGSRMRTSNLHLNEVPNGRDNGAEKILEEITTRIFQIYKLY